MTSYSRGTFNVVIPAQLISLWKKNIVFLSRYHLFIEDLLNSFTKTLSFSLLRVCHTDRLESIGREYEV